MHGWVSVLVVAVGVVGLLAAATVPLPRAARLRREIARWRADVAAATAALRAVNDGRPARRVRRGRAAGA